MSEMFLVNPGRRRRSRKRRRKHMARAHHTNPSRKRRRRHYRRNPGLALGRGFDLHSIGWGVVGAVGTELGAAAAAKVLPASLQGNNLAKLGVKAGIVLVGGMLARKVIGPSAAKAVVIGGGISVGVELVRDYVLPVIPGAQSLMSGYVFNGGALNGYVPADGSLSGIPADRWPSNWGG